MYAIVKTGGKQYKVAAGDYLNIEKLDAEVGAKVPLTAIAVVDGDKVVADPAKAAKTKVEAEVVEQFKGEKQIIFKFKKRKNYKRTRGHRQNLTRVKIVSVGSAKRRNKKEGIEWHTRKVKVPSVMVVILSRSVLVASVSLVSRSALA